MQPCAACAIGPLPKARHCVVCPTVARGSTRPGSWSSGRTPAAVYVARPKAGPNGRDDLHWRVRHDRIHTGRVSLRINGNMHHIGLSRTLDGTRIVMLIVDLDVRVIHATTGETIRTLTIDPQPPLPRHQQTPRRPQRTPKPKDPNPDEGSDLSDVSRHHMERMTGIEPAFSAWEADVGLDAGEKRSGVALRGEGRVAGDAATEVEVADLEPAAGKFADRAELSVRAH